MTIRVAVSTATVLVGVMGLGQVLGDSTLCREFQAVGWPGSEKLQKFALTSTIEGHFDNLDVDGDDVVDAVSLGCSASNPRPDPCILLGKLSSGASIEFEAWRMYLIRYRGLIYAVTANENGAGHEILRVGPANVDTVCTAP
jgi:hypothetical protein